MKKTVLVALAGVLVVPVLALVAGSPEVAAQIDDGLNAANTGTGVTADADSIITTVINIMLYIIGAVSVIMLIYGGIRYTTSGGSQNSVTAAKNTILYAIIGLVVAIFAWAIVNWVIGSLT